MPSEFTHSKRIVEGAAGNMGTGVNADQVMEMGARMISILELSGSPIGVRLLGTNKRPRLTQKCSNDTVIVKP